MAKGAYIGVDGIARKIKKGYVGVKNFEPRGLPEGYTQVEYIESSGTQYIDTGFIPNSETSVLLECEVGAITSSKNYAYFGARTKADVADKTSNTLRIEGSSYKNHSAFYGSSVYGATYISGRHTILREKNVTTVAGESFTNTYTLEASPYSMYIFATNTAGTAGLLMPMKVYLCKIYDNGTLVRDFVPCTDSDGNAGLYDLIGNQFYSNAGSDSFSVGTSTQSAARKVKRAYIGVGGVARPFWSGGELAYWGTTTDLSKARRYLAGASVGNHALFAGGTSETTVDAYDTNLTRNTPTALRKAREDLAGASVGDYALFAGGTDYADRFYATVDAYNTNLTRSLPTALSQARKNLAGASVGNYALFAGGEVEDSDNFSSQFSIVDAYDTNLVRSTPTALSQARSYLAGASVGNYALFAGGISNQNYISTVNAYNTSLTRSTLTKLSKARYYLAGASVGDYALFAGGHGSGIAATVDAYDTNLTKGTPMALSVARQALAGASVGDYALFAGGFDGSSTSYSTVDAYNTNLTRSLPTALSQARKNLAGASVGNYALFAGGIGDTFSSTVDVYTVS